MSLRDDISTFIKDAFLESSDAVPARTDSLFQGQILDSLAMTILIAHIEENYQIRIDAMDIVYENFDTVEKIAAYIESRT